MSAQDSSSIMWGLWTKHCKWRCKTESLNNNPHNRGTFIHQLRLGRSRKLCLPESSWQHFWDQKGVLPVDFIAYGTTINSQVYCERSKKLWRTIQSKRCILLTSGVVLLHDNVRPHTTAHMMRVAWQFQMGSVWSPTVQPWPSSEWLSPFQSHEKMAA